MFYYASATEMIHFTFALDVTELDKKNVTTKSQHKHTFFKQNIELKEVCLVLNSKKYLKLKIFLLQHLFSDATSFDVLLFNAMMFICSFFLVLSKILFGTIVCDCLLHLLKKEICIEIMDISIAFVVEGF